MALVTVRPKDNPDAPTLVVDEAWLRRWPEDFDLVSDAEETAADAAISTISAPAGEGESTPKGDASPPEQGSARNRF